MEELLAHTHMCSRAEGQTLVEPVKNETKRKKSKQLGMWRNREECDQLNPLHAQT